MKKNNSFYWYNFQDKALICFSVLVMKYVNITAVPSIRKRFCAPLCTLKNKWIKY